MGNCCGTQSGNFSGEGRTLGATPANAPPPTDNARASAPKISSQKGGRTLGNNSQAPGDSTTPKEAAARAAEVGCSTSSPRRRLKCYERPGGRMVSTAWI